MPLTVINQNNLGLGNDGNYACGVACGISVLTSLHVAPTPPPTDIFREISTTRITHSFGATPANIADYLISQGLRVYYNNNMQRKTGSPIGKLLEANLLFNSNAIQLPLGPLPNETYYIHFLKVRNLNPAGHFVVSDGAGNYMDPDGGNIVHALPAGPFPNNPFYDTGLTLIVTR